VAALTLIAPFAHAGVAGAARARTARSGGAGTARSAHAERASFAPRIGLALGMLPDRAQQEIAAGAAIPVVYHGGPVMRDVTVHTVFWAPSGYRFDGPPSPGTLGYQALIEQFLTDVAAASGQGAAAQGPNVLSVLSQYGDRTGPGSTAISYDPASDSIVDTDPYPPAGEQCPSPSGVATCITDLELQRELDRVIGANPSQRGLSNLWVILLPPDVDTCTNVGSCASNAYAGYHSAFALGSGETVYAVIPDPLVEFTPPPGADPEGNPEAETTVDTLAHELVEAITDPLGTGWMDPNGFEVGDKCENGPQIGMPLGYAPDGSPYNQLIDGHAYLIQDMWSDARDGCVQGSSSAAPAPPLQTVSLRQFSASVSGSLGVAERLSVRVSLVRAGVTVAAATGRSRADGSWGPLVLRGARGVAHAVGDDRDILRIYYSGAPGAPPPDLIATGDGGDPFTASGFTGFSDLDHGYAIVSRAGVTEALVGPCTQTGVLTLRAGPLVASPTDLCQTESDAAVISLPRVGAATPLSLSSLDNRGVYLLAPHGTLVRLTIPLGEPGARPAAPNPHLPFAPTGFPVCTAFLRIAVVRCSGLVAGARYRLQRFRRTIARSRAGSAGVVRFSDPTLRGGEVLSLLNAGGRRLTSLHVARLRVSIVGTQTTVAAGVCQPGDYWGAPPPPPRPTAAVGVGLAGSGRICPTSGRARGLPDADIAQTDDFSGGQTVLQVPLIESTSPIQDETLYGPFIASAQSGLPGPRGTTAAGGVPISLAIEVASSGRVVFQAADVDTAAGVPVPGLRPGAYIGRWVLRDRNGDTRTLTTRFYEAR